MQTSAGDQAESLSGTETTAGDKRSHSYQPPGIGKVSAVNYWGSSNSSREHAEILIRSNIEELYQGSYRGIIWNSMGNNHQTDSSTKHSLLTAEETSLLGEKEDQIAPLGKESTHIFLKITQHWKIPFTQRGTLMLNWDHAKSVVEQTEPPPGICCWADKNPS